jgi:branched-chain amino acid transport system ATP-binding protein
VLDTVRRIRAEGITVLLVEQRVLEALELCDRGYVLQSGRLVMEASGEELIRTDLVRKAYLGM